MPQPCIFFSELFHVDLLNGQLTQGFPELNVLRPRPVQPDIVHPGVPCAGTQCDNMGVVTLAASGINTNQDFGYRPSGLGWIGDRVWTDTNANGVQDAGETGINGVVVRLYQDEDGDGILDEEDAYMAETTTDGTGVGAGSYRFIDLAVGNYIVQIDPANFGSGQPLQSLTMSNTGSAYDVAQVSCGVFLDTGEEFTDADFGFTSSAIGDFIWQDNNGDGLQDYGEPGIPDVVVNLYRDLNENGGFEWDEYSYYLADQQYSTVALLDVNGNVLERYGSPSFFALLRRRGIDYNPRVTRGVEI